VSTKKHLMITPDGEPLPRWQQVFPQSNTIAFGYVVKTDADIVWLKLDGLVQSKSQIDWVKLHYCQFKFVVLTSIPLVSEALLSLSAGARAYANAHAGPKNLQQIADVVTEGGIWVGEDLLRFLITSLTQIKTTEALSQHNEWRQKVSHREAEVIEGVAMGVSNKVIARQLDISERTVKAHLTTVFEKLGVRDRFKLALLVNGKFNAASLT
jgi:DNA-binding NarL/FixJ family response regulator